MLIFAKRSICIASVNSKIYILIKYAKYSIR